MFKRLLIILIAIVLVSCGNQKKEAPKKPLQTVKKPIEAPVEKAPIPEPDLITDKNVVDKLTKYGKENPETIAAIYTTKGKIKIKLYTDTPLHRANFILLAKKGYFNGCLFSRVSKNFMAQFGGSYDEEQKEIQAKIGVYTIPAEMSHHHFHKKGAIAAARSYHNNPDKRSAMDELYLVEGLKFSDISLDKYERENHYKFTQEQRNYYLKNPGAAHIDGEHTVFGEIIEGYEVVPKLTHVKTDSQEWPNVDMYVDSVIIIQ